MAQQSKYQEAVKTHLKTLKQYVPVVDRVHGQNHPEFHDVRRLFESLAARTAEAGRRLPQLNGEFEQLRLITSNYTVPGDVCESYEAVYKMLSALDLAYRETLEA